MKRQLLHKGKAKSVYTTNQEDQVIIEYRDDASAFNGVKKAALKDKGKLNNHLNAYLMEKLEAVGIKTHFIKQLSGQESLMKKLRMLPIECVVRNYAAGGICKRLGLQTGTKFNSPIFEFFLKDDPLGDPMINESHILSFNWATPHDIDFMKHTSFAVNRFLTELFDKADLLLVDFKLEFGRFKDHILLGDEVTPDGMRLWDKNTKEIFDKDRFRQDLGHVVAHYTEVARRIGLKLPVPS